LILCEDGCVYGLDNSSKTLEQLNSVQLDSQFSLAINYLHQSQLLLVVGINCKNEHIDDKKGLIEICVVSMLITDLLELILSLCH